MDKVYQDAVDNNDIAGAILVAQDVTKKFNYTRAYGQRTMLDGSKKPQEADDILNTYSSTKLVTSIAALQCVEKGLFTLDEDVSRLLPNLGEIQILTGFDDNDEPQYEAKRGPITLKLMLTHSAGFSYDFTQPLCKWRELRGEHPMYGTTVAEWAGTPLVFQPGTSWTYGVGLDWVGKMVEKVSGMTLEEYNHAHIFPALGITNASFKPLQHEAIRAKMIDLNPDDPDGTGMAGVGGISIGTDWKDCSGSGGIFMSPVDFVKILSSLLANDGKLLKPETVDLMFRPSLSAESHKALNQKLEDPQWNEHFGQGPPVGTERDHGYGGMIIQDALPRWHQEGTMLWSGGATLGWFIDRKAGLCGMVAPQYLMRDMPAKRKEKGDPKPWRDGGRIYEELTLHLRQTFRKGIYGVYEEWKSAQC